LSKLGYIIFIINYENLSIELNSGDRYLVTDTLLCTATFLTLDNESWANGWITVAYKFKIESTTTCLKDAIIY
jgi:hypothetical protein